MRVFFIILFCVQIIYGQTRSVSGVITDQQGNGIPRSILAVKATNGATQMSSTRGYTIQSPLTATLVFSVSACQPGIITFRNQHQYLHYHFSIPTWMI